MGLVGGVGAHLGPGLVDAGAVGEVGVEGAGLVGADDVLAGVEEAGGVGAVGLPDPDALGVVAVGVEAGGVGDRRQAVEGVPGVGGEAAALDLLLQQVAVRVPAVVGGGRGAAAGEGADLLEEAVGVVVGVGDDAALVLELLTVAYPS